MSIGKQVEVIRHRIAQALERSGRKHVPVTLIGVTKYVGPDEARELYRAGLRDFGENRLQVARPKLDAFARWSFNDVTWHFIGHLQTNKVKDVIRHFSVIHSLDRWNLAEEIQKRAAELGIQVPCCIQVNISGESTKGGFAPPEVHTLLQDLSQLPNIRPIGLMTMAPRVEHAEETRGIFRNLRILRDELQAKGFDKLIELSMGMSQDFEIAIEEGATMIRLGQILYEA
jgi:pyridoxal phosphate enzyme (YggS family)